MTEMTSRDRAIAQLTAELSGTEIAGLAIGAATELQGRIIAGALVASGSRVADYFAVRASALSAIPSAVEVVAEYNSSGLSRETVTSAQVATRSNTARSSGVSRRMRPAEPGIPYFTQHRPTHPSPTLPH